MQRIAHVVSLGLLMIFESPFLDVKAQQSTKKTDKSLDNLKDIGATIARAVLRKDWSAVLRYEIDEPPGERANHERSLKDRTSDLYCFLVDSKCKPGYADRPSVFELFSGARDLAITVIDLGKSRRDGNRYAVLMFYDRSAMSDQSMRSPKFFCRPDNFRRFASWTFMLVDGKWESPSWLFSLASDSPC